MEQSLTIQGHSMTIVEADQRPDLSAGLDNESVLAIVAKLDRLLDAAMGQVNHLLGTQVSSDKAITKLGSDALKMRGAIIRAQGRLGTMLERGIENGQLQIEE